MPVIDYPHFHKYPQVKGVFVGGCIERGDGSSFRAKAHAHTSQAHAHHGWICVRSPKRLYMKDGRPSNLMLHELAHILTGHGHDDVWRKKMRELGARMQWWYKKKKKHPFYGIVVKDGFRVK